MAKKVYYEGASRIGMRPRNNDAFLAGALSSGRGASLRRGNAKLNTPKAFALCDGVGNLKKSGAFARLALKEVQKAAKNAPKDDPALMEKWISDALRKANARLLKEGGVRVGGTTISLLLLSENHYAFGNVGDSLCFLKKGEEKTELSHSHNAAAQKRRMGEEVYPADESILLHCLGEGAGVQEEITSGSLEEGMQFLLFTDGCTKLASASNEGFFSAKALVDASSKMVRADNSTAISIQIR